MTLFIFAPYKTCATYPLRVFQLTKPVAICVCLVTYKKAFTANSGRGLQRQEILEELLAGIGEDGFGVELHAFNFVTAVTQTHDDAAVSLGRDRKFAGQ